MQPTVRPYCCFSFYFIYLFFFLFPSGKCVRNIRSNHKGHFVQQTLEKQHKFLDGWTIEDIRHGRWWKIAVSLLSLSIQLHSEPWLIISVSSSSQQLIKMFHSSFGAWLPLTCSLWHLHLIYAKVPLVCACFSLWINAIKPSSKFSIYLHSRPPCITKKPVWWHTGLVWLNKNSLRQMSLSILSLYLSFY